MTARWPIIVAVSGAALVLEVFAAEPSPEINLDDFQMPVWSKSGSLRSSFGYRDNVTLSGDTSGVYRWTNYTYVTNIVVTLVTNVITVTNQPEPTKGSAFWSAGGDLMVYRLPSGGWQFNGFGSFDNTTYLDQSLGVSDEQMVMGMLQLTKDWGEGWRWGQGFQVIHQNQVMDMSVAGLAIHTNAHVVFNCLSTRTFVRKDFAPWWMEAEANSMRILIPNLDDYTQPGVRLAAGRTYGKGSEVSGAGQYYRSIFEHRMSSDAQGQFVPGTLLRQDYVSMDLSWKHVWDESARWQTTTSAGMDLTQDNGAGFNDYYRGRVSEQVRCTVGRWQVTAQGRWDFSQYLVQTVSGTDLRMRDKTMISYGATLTRSLGKSWKVYLSYSREHSLSEVGYDRYTSQTISGGVEYRF